MLNIGLFVLGFLLFSFALFNWRDVVNALGGYIAAVWISLVLIIMASSSGNGSMITVSATEKGLRLVGVLTGAILIVLAFIVGPAVAGGGDPREVLDHAIRAFQAYAGLTADGVFGPATVRAYYGK